MSRIIDVCLNPLYLSLKCTEQRVMHFFFLQYLFIKYVVRGKAVHLFNFKGNIKS